MRTKMKALAFAATLGAAACGTVDETAPERQADIGEPVGPAGLTALDSCEQVARWIDQNRDTLPSSYDQIIRFPDPYRRAIFGAHGPEVQAALFRSQIARFRLRTSLTNEQQAVLDRADALMSSALYAPHDSPAYLATVDSQAELKRQAMNAFGFEETRALMAHLGPTDATTSAPLAIAAAPPSCQCSTQSDYCWWGTHCHSIPCVPIGRCGDWFGFRCNGVCGQGL